MAGASLLAGLVGGPAATQPAVSAPDSGPQRLLHVAPDGQDRGPGNERHPYRTLEHAQQQARGWLSRGLTVNVVLHEGVYRLTETLRFDARDSGRDGAPVRWTSAPGADVTVTGATELAEPWTPFRDGIYVAEVGTGRDFDQLYVNGERQVLARYPNIDPGQPVLDGYAADALSPQRVATWSDPTTGYVRALHCNDWGGNSFRIDGVNADHTLQLTWVGDNNRSNCMHGSKRVVENIFEELDAPSEWFYDAQTGELYFYPPAGLDVSTATVEGAGLDELITVTGAGAAEPAGHLSFEGITFTGTHRTLFNSEYEPLLLGDWAIVRKAAVRLKNAVDVSVLNSTFSQVGGNAIFVDGYNSGHRIAGNRFEHSGASDVAVVGCTCSVRNPRHWNGLSDPGTDVPITDLAPGPKTEDYPRDVRIEGNVMTDMGVFEKQTSGVQISMSEGIEVIGNTVHHGPRAGINVNDGTWGGHLIADNDIFDMVRETGDHGPFNSWGRDRYWSLRADDATKKQYALLDAQQPTVIRHNRIWHDSEWAIDLDDGSSNYIIENNIMLNAGFKLREGYRRVVRNNIVLGGSGHFHVSYPDNDDQIVTNILAGADPYQFIQSDPGASKTVYDRNVFWNDGNAVADIDAAWLARGLDVDSVIADPQFAAGNPWEDPAMRDFRVSEASPAIDRGFANFSMDFGVPGAPQPPPIAWRLPPPGVIGTVDAQPEPFLGATATGIHSEALKSSVGLGDRNGLYLSVVPADSPAHAAGLRSGDVIRTVAGVEVGDRSTFWRTWLTRAPGQPVALGVWRNQAMTSMSAQRPADVEIVNDTAGVTYTGGGWDWKNAARGGAGSSHDDLWATQTNGESFELSWNGTGLDLISQINSDEGDIDIYLDGQFLQTISAHNDTRVYQQTILDIRDLPAGEHTLRGVKTNGDYMIVDGFRLFG
ncbi:PDZ domain-containing protein [Jiangella alkaliphila]|uniref:Right handed beta helix region n=1 Tax=Jiangella alkaliphila TaxID=419479 RepID=A0A1H2L6N4_9ACTN|nr:PDZ domain-containing protein [Jiangella alkaliphila]SDU76727.1 Right handed beta helix region [Jiangella alkaliphila]